MPRTAGAQSAAACSDAFDRAQQSRDDGKYRRSLAQFLTCAREVCPKEIRNDCIHEVTELESLAPTVVISALDSEGKDLTAVRVYVDGEPLLDRLHGRPTMVDAGPQTFRYELAGHPAREEQVVIRTGEKNRILSVQFGKSSSPPPPPASSSPGIPTLTWVFGGVAVVAFATETFFGLSGLAGKRDCKSRVAPDTWCTGAEVDAIGTKFLVSDVALGVGLVSVGLATYFFFTARPREPASSVSVDVHATAGGGLAKLGLAF